MTPPAIASNCTASESLPGKTPPQLYWERAPGMNLAVRARPLLRELHLTLVPKIAETVDGLVDRLAEVLKRHGAVVVRQLVFGSVAAHAGTMRALRRALGEVDWPITWTEGGSCVGAPVAGMQIHAVAGASVQTLTRHRRPVGRVFDDGEARHCLLGDLGPTHGSASRQQQARETFAELENALALADMTMKDVARTWLFLDDILSWYGPFNEVRNDFFARCELRPGSFPASTGVSGRNPRGTALLAGAWAVRPHSATARVQVAPSPKQCPAPAYGKAFSRAVEIRSRHDRHLLISGTASIAPDGRTAHVGDARRQIELTMEVVGAILRSRGQTFADVTRAVAYFKSPADFPLFAEWCVRNEPGLPVVSAGCDICRDDLLFEIELDALSCC
jgi:enamine deaminase RidA (YjgF/YER057c/UK114 family)